MSINTMAHHRKATTYGKASRRPIVATVEAFAKATEAEAWDFEQNMLILKSDATRRLENTANDPRHSAGVGNLRDSSNPGSLNGLQKYKRTKPIRQSIASVSAVSRPVKGESLPRLSLSEDDLQQNSKTSLESCRKRRKNSPEAAVEDCGVVYDDASLQRHIAAECRNDLRRSPSLSDRARSYNNPLQRHSQDKTGHSHREKGGEPLKVRATRKLKELESGTNNVDRASNEFKDRSGTSRRKTPCRNVQKANQEASKAAARFITPETISPTAETELAGDQLESTVSSIGECNPPVTPPRPFNSTEGSTTPRQRELWNKLLVADDPHRSPATLGLPGLVENDEVRKTAKVQAMGAHTTCDSIEGDIHESRRKKIVDTLHPCDLDISGEDVIDTGSVDTSDLSDYRGTETSFANGAITAQTSPSSDGQSKRRLSTDHIQSGVPQPISSLHGVGLKVTYARQRSYLTNSDLDEITMLSLPATTESVNTNEASRKAIRDRPPKSQQMQRFESRTWDNQDSQGGAMRSIHELREAGGNVRLVSELEAILDDIEADELPSGMFRRTRLLDLTAKLQEPSNSRLFVDQGLEMRLLAHIRPNADIITNSLFAIAILQLTAGPTSTLFLSQVSDARIVDFLVDLLGMDQNLATHAKSRDCNLSKYARQEYSNVCSSISKSGNWRAGNPRVISCHVLALQCLEYLLRQTRDSGSSSDLISAYAIRRIVTTSIPPSSPPLPQYTTTSAVHLEIAVSILESCTISNVAECQESLWEGETLERVVSLLPLLCSWKEDERGTSRSLTLRLYVNLTNNHPRLCDDLSVPEMVETVCKMIIAYFEQLSSHAVGRHQSMILENLILSLGFLVNLAESSDIVRQLVAELHYEDRSYLNVLLELFMIHSESTAEVSLLS